MVVGRPNAWPTIWSRWLRAYRVKSGIFNATVDQKATTPVSEGTNTLKNSPNVWNFDGDESIGPKPPALPRAQSSSASPISSRKGAVTPCKKRIVLIPRTITSTLRIQKNRKHTGTPQLTLFQAGAKTTIIA